jgi:hypothetical protein
MLVDIVALLADFTNNMKWQISAGYRGFLGRYIYNVQMLVSKRE